MLLNTLENVHILRCITLRCKYKYKLLKNILLIIFSRLQFQTRVSVYSRTSLKGLPGLRKPKDKYFWFQQVYLSTLLPLKMKTSILFTSKKNLSVIERFHFYKPTCVQWDRYVACYSNTPSSVVPVLSWHVPCHPCMHTVLV